MAYRFGSLNNWSPCMTCYWSLMIFGLFYQLTSHKLRGNCKLFNLLLFGEATETVQDWIRRDHTVSYHTIEIQCTLTGRLGGLPVKVQCIFVYHTFKINKSTRVSRRKDLNVKVETTFENEVLNGFKMKITKDNLKF